MEVLQAYLHRSDIDVELLEAGEQIEQVVWCQGQPSRFDILRCETERAEGEGGSQGARGRRGCRGPFWQSRGWGYGNGAGALTRPMTDLASLELEGVGESLLVRSHKAGELLCKRSAHD